MPESPPQLLFPGHVHPTKPPLAPETKILLWKKPAGVCILYEDGHVSLEMGFWELDGQTRSEALQKLSAVLEESRSSSAILPFFPFPPFPILMQEELEKRAQDRTDGVREDRYILVRTVHARSLQCKAASKKNTWKRLSPPVAPFNAIRQAVEPTRARVWHKICKFYLSGKLHCQSSPVASTKAPGRNPHWRITLPVPCSLRTT